MPGKGPDLCPAGGDRASSSRARGLASSALKEHLVDPAAAYLPQDLLQHGLVGSQVRVSLGELEQLVEQVRVESTQARRRLISVVLAFRAEGLPFAAFARAVEQLQRKRGRGHVANEAGYFVAALRGIRDEEFRRSSVS